jgi:hypothetical protein
MVVLSDGESRRSPEPRSSSADDVLILRKSDVLAKVAGDRKQASAA